MEKPNGVASNAKEAGNKSEKSLEKNVDASSYTIMARFTGADLAGKR